MTGSYFDIVQFSILTAASSTLRCGKNQTSRLSKSRQSFSLLQCARLGLSSKAKDDTLSGVGGIGRRSRQAFGAERCDFADPPLFLVDQNVHASISARLPTTYRTLLRRLYLVTNELEVVRTKACRTRCQSSYSLCFPSRELTHSVHVGLDHWTFEERRLSNHHHNR